MKVKRKKQQPTLQREIEKEGEPQPREEPRKKVADMSRPIDPPHYQEKTPVQQSAQPEIQGMQPATLRSERSKSLGG